MGKETNRNKEKYQEIPSARYRGEIEEAERGGMSENEKEQGVEDKDARFLTVCIRLLDCARPFPFTKPKPQASTVVILFYG